MSGDVSVRAALPEDLPGLRQVARETWSDTYRGRVPDADIDRFLDANYSLEFLERAREQRAQVGRSEGMLVAIDGDEVVGYVMAGPNREGEAEVFAIYVLPSLHGRGVGYRLWERVNVFFRDQALERFHLWVLDGNERACAFYERQGGCLTGERPFPVGETQIVELRYEFVIDDSA